MTEFCCFKKTLFKLFSIWFDVGKNSGEINKEAYRETILKIVKTPTIIAWKKWHRKKDNIHLYLLLFLSTFLYINVAFSFYLRISAKTSSSTFDYLSTEIACVIQQYSMFPHSLILPGAALYYQSNDHSNLQWEMQTAYRSCAVCSKGMPESSENANHCPTIAAVTQLELLCTGTSD